ncbi:TPA: P-II family nitrogen regulator [Candidatus Poribacteria bacterium]|nr:P-II family nitrogen regulator [Candidatus Poribacteria bacterium]
MKLVTAILRPEVLNKVREALFDVDIPGMTVTEVKGFGKQKGHTELYRGNKFTVEFMHKVKLEIAISNKNLDLLINTISNIARSGQKGDGKIFVTEIEKVVRIRTGETDLDAL